VELPNKADMALLLLKKAFVWAREGNPSQPITSGVWRGVWSDASKLGAMERCQLEESDVISFHSYGKLDEVRGCVASLRCYGRPILCTEYMARPQGSRFDPVLGYFQQEGVGAYNWGFVDGRSQTIYPWTHGKRHTHLNRYRGFTMFAPGRDTLRPEGSRIHQIDHGGCEAQGKCPGTMKHRLLMCLFVDAVSNAHVARPDRASVQSAVPRLPAEPGHPRWR